MQEEELQLTISADNCKTVVASMCFHLILKLEVSAPMLGRFALEVADTVLVQGEGENKTLTFDVINPHVNWLRTEPVLSLRQRKEEVEQLRRDPPRQPLMSRVELEQSAIRQHQLEIMRNKQARLLQQ